MWELQPDCSTVVDPQAAYQYMADYYLWNRTNSLDATEIYESDHMTKLYGYDNDNDNEKYLFDHKSTNSKIQ